MNRDLSFKERLALGGALFSMHFGASSMIWPMTWGKESGKEVALAFLGIYFTAVFIPLLGYFALAKGGTFLDLSRRVSDRFAAIFCNITILLLGPLFVIPRMSAAVWGAFTQITGYNPDNILPIAVFSIVYYILVYWFVSGKDNIIEKISKILLPVLLLVVVGVVTKGIVSPLSIQGEKIYSEPSIVYGLLQGYATVELPTALLLGGVIVNSLKHKGIDGKLLNSNLIKIGIIGTTLLAVSHFFHMYIGSMTDGLFIGLKYSELYAAVVMDLWGIVGGIIFNVGLLFAALSCAVGLTSATSHFYEEFSQGSIVYKKASIYIIVASCFVGVLGLETIVKIVGPLLKLIYPPGIVITICHSLIPRFVEKEDMIYGMRYGAYGAMIVGGLSCIYEYLDLFGIKISLFTRFINFLPLSKYELSWVIFSILGFILGIFLYKIKNRR